MAQSSKLTVAYVPFATFIDAINILDRMRDLPQRFDTSIWPMYSPAIRSQLVATFRFLGLIDGSAKPTDLLRTLVREKENRQLQIRNILESSYPRIIALGLTKISPRQFDIAMREYGMTGETHKKVISFFLRAAQYAELPMSPLLGRRVRSTGSRRHGHSETPTPKVFAVSEPDFTAPSAQPISRTITLRSGGTVSLLAAVKLLEMEKSDREFVFALIDQLNNYERQDKKTPDRITRGAS